MPSLTLGASIADSEMKSTLDLDSRRMAGETYSTAQYGSIVVQKAYSTAQCGSIVVPHVQKAYMLFLALAGFIYTMRLRKPRERVKLDQPHLSENVARSL